LSIARDICATFDRDPNETITHVCDRNFNDRRYFINSSKLLALGWLQHKSWDAGLAETVEWYATQDLESYWGDIAQALEPHPVFAPSRVISFLDEIDDICQPADSRLVQNAAY